MIQFPSSSSVGRVIPKEAFYQRLNLSADLKAAFVADIRRITIEHSLSPASLRLKPGAEVLEIIVLGMELKQPEVNERLLEQIARQNPHKLLFWLRYEGQGRLALYTNKLYQTDWQVLEVMQLETRGFNLDEVWDGYLSQIALRPDLPLAVAEGPAVYRLKRQEEIIKLEKDIEKLEAAARAEKQPRKKFALAMQAQQLRRELEQR